MLKIQSSAKKINKTEKEEEKTQEIFNKEGLGSIPLPGANGA